MAVEGWGGCGNSIEKVWNIARITEMWHRDTKWAHAVGKMAPIDSLEAVLPQNIQFVENAISAKRNKKRQACNAVL
jgi:hypothetical protein